MKSFSDRVYDLLRKVPAGRVTTYKEIAHALGRLTRSKKVAGMAEAVTEARASASPGETVLFSPACASFDMYENYKERGDDFRNAVNRLATREMK